MLCKHKLSKSFALLLLLKMCMPVSVHADYDYVDYDVMDEDEALSVYYGNHMEEQPVITTTTEAPSKKESQSAQEEKPDTSQPRPETKEQDQVVSDQEQATVGPNVDLRQLSSQNTNAIKKIAGIVAEVVSKLSTQGCVGASGNGVNHNMEMLSSSIKEGFTVLVGAVQDLNTTLQTFQAEISKKVFGSQRGDAAFESDGPCPAPFFLVGSDCLYIETEHLRDFQTARQACIDMGAKLAEFTDFEPFIQAVNKMEMRHDAAIYIGGTDEGHEGEWRWLSGGTMENIKWDEDEPNNSGDREHCISLRVEVGSFNDLSCTERTEYACIKK